MLSPLFKLLSSLVLLYTLAVIARILLTWLHGPFTFGKPFFYLARITDPYLNYFRRFTFLRIGSFDFSAVAALIALSILGNILNSLAVFGRISVGLILALLLSALWSAAAFFLLLFIVLIVIRLIGLLSGSNSTGSFWRTLDIILNPLLLPVTRFFLGGRDTTYRNGLLIGGAAFLGLRVIGGFLIRQLVLILERLPF